MRNILVVSALMLWTVGMSQKAENGTDKPVLASKSLLMDLEGVVKSGAKKANGILKGISAKVNPHCVEPPQYCPNPNITFWYYSRLHRDIPIQISIASLRRMTYNLRNPHPWKIIIHGYTKSKDEIPNPQLRSAYFKNGPYNLISVDYSPLARDKCYIQAVANVQLIANCTAQLIDALIDRQFVNSDSLHIIGFSLGAHIAGNIYAYMRNSLPGRITGLDPASPLFDGFLNARLTPNSAEFVDVIHTNVLIKGQLPTAGHVDFYVNGGISQPGCPSSSQDSFSTCSHNRSPLYFAESINTEVGFWAKPCNKVIFGTDTCNVDEADLILMGEYVPRDPRGIYQVRTRDKEPFALGKRANWEDDY